MSNLTQEFFWKPEELSGWLRRVCGEAGLWLVVWHVGRNADLANPSTIGPSMFEAAEDDSIQLFLGKPSICPAPQWRVVGDRRELDFKQSYAVQLVPSILAPDRKTLLQGRLAILRAPDYDDKARAAELASLFRRLESDLKRESDSGRVVVQPLSNGEKKRWSRMLIGRSIPDTGLKLKQFSRGEVEFQVDPA
jgi:hypothetical protein